MAFMFHLTVNQLNQLINSLKMNFNKSIEDELHQGMEGKHMDDTTVFQQPNGV